MSIRCRDRPRQTARNSQGSRMRIGNTHTAQHDPAKKCARHAPPIHALPSCEGLSSGVLHFLRAVLKSSPAQSGACAEIISGNDLHQSPSAPPITPFTSTNTARKGSLWKERRCLPSNPADTARSSADASPAGPGHVPPPQVFFASRPFRLELGQGCAHTVFGTMQRKEQFGVAAPDLKGDVFIMRQRIRQPCPQIDIGRIDRFPIRTSQQLDGRAVRNPPLDLMRMLNSAPCLECKDREQDQGDRTKPDPDLCPVRFPPNGNFFSEDLPAPRPARTSPGARQP